MAGNDLDVRFSFGGTISADAGVRILHHNIGGGIGLEAKAEPDPHAGLGLSVDSKNEIKVKADKGHRLRRPW